MRNCIEALFEANTEGQRNQDRRQGDPPPTPAYNAAMLRQVPKLGQGSIPQPFVNQRCKVEPLGSPTKMFPERGSAENTRARGTARRLSFVRNSISSTLSDPWVSPLAPHVLSEEVPQGFVLSKFQKFHSTTDPVDHLMQYKQEMPYKTLQMLCCAKSSLQASRA